LQVMNFCRYKSILLLVASVLFFNTCSLVGIHLKVKNPKRAGTYPKLTKAQHLLASPGHNRECYDVKYNKLDVTITPSTKSIQGTVQIKALARYVLDTIQIDLHPRMKINDVKIDSLPARFNRIEGAILIKVPKRIGQGEVFSITMLYEGKPMIAKNPPWRGGTVWKKDKDGLDWCGVACETEGANIWWPNKDDLFDEADSTDISLTVPNTVMAVSNGLLKEKKENKDKTTNYHWHVSYPINNYNVTYYVGNFKLVRDTFLSKLNGQPILLDYYVLPKHLRSAKYHFQQVKRHLAFYEKLFGAYPWPKDGFKLVESPYSGMEHQTAIAYGNGFKNGPDGFDYIILHETAHEWWGNSVTAADFSDVWLQEGFATFAEALYVEFIKGRDAYLNYLHWQKITIGNKRPVVRPSGIRYFSYKDEDVYVKGSWVLHSLRTVINNDSLFFDILKTFRIQNHLKQIYSTKFIELINEKTGKDYTWFFKQYLYKREAPMLEFYSVNNYLYYRWKDTETGFDKLPVKVNYNKMEKIIYPSKVVQRLNTNLQPKEVFNFNDDEVYFGTKQNARLVKEYQM
jgi:aminopeptidase N